MSAMSDENFKYIGIVLLTLQQASMPLMARYSRFREEDEVFFTTVNVFMMEIIKITVCSAILIYNSKSVFKFLSDCHEAILGDKVETAKVCVPALIYTLQNNLYYISLSHLEATTFYITYQMKIFTTALMLRVLLGKRLSGVQWGALVLLVIGVVDVQLQYNPPRNNQAIVQRPIVGLTAVAVMCFSSALAGVYLEKVLKESKQNVWMQNIRLALLGIPISAISMLWNDFAGIQEYGMFRGFDTITWIMTITNSVGGLLISIVIKYADNIYKAYAQSMAIIGAAVGSWLLFDFVPNTLFMFGAGLVTISIFLYTAYPYKAPASLVQFNKPISVSRTNSPSYYPGKQ